jgi:hypothetical protein
VQLGLQQGKRSAALPPRPISDAPHRSQPAETSHLVSNFPYVCPEPALANVRFSLQLFYKMAGTKKRRRISSLPGWPRQLETLYKAQSAVRIGWISSCMDCNCSGVAHIPP